MIKLANVEKVYESGAGKTWVLRRINLDIAEGDFITIMGPSGAGKSTLMGIVGMLDGAWKGEYYLLENPVHKLDNRRRVELHKKYIGFVFQQYHLLDNLTVAENLDLPLSYRDIKKAEREGMVADILDRFQIVGKKSLLPESTFRRTAAARRRRPRRDRQAQADSRRRAYRQPPFEPGKNDHGPAQAPQRRRHHNHSGDAQRRLGRLRQPHHSVGRWLDR